MNVNISLTVSELAFMVAAFFVFGIVIGAAVTASFMEDKNQGRGQL